MQSDEELPHDLSNVCRTANLKCPPGLCLSESAHNVDALHCEGNVLY
jgi:hypothetical protein